LRPLPRVWKVLSKSVIEKDRNTGKPCVGENNYLVSMTSSIRSFCSAKTCSMRERIFDLALLPRRTALGMMRPFGFLRWTWLTKPFFAMNSAFAAAL
jgi:hypothetical protein